MNDKTVPYVSNYDKLSTKMKSVVFKNDDEVMQVFDKLRVSIISIASYAHEYDHIGVVGNGYWAGLRAVNRLLEVALFKWKSNPFVVIDFPILLKRMVKIMQLMDKLHDASVAEASHNRSERPNLFVSGYQFTMVSMDLFTDAKGEEAAEAMLRSFPGFTCPRNGRVAKTIYNIVAFRGIESGLELFKWCFSYNHRIKSAVHKLLTMDIFYFRKLFDSFNVKINSHLIMQNALLWVQPSICRTVYFDLQTEWKISSTNLTERVKRVAPKSNRVIRCRLLIDAPVKSNSDEIPTGSLIFHFHGGAISCSYPEDHEAYLRDWSIKLPGTALLIPEFSLCPEIRFPVFLQEILDLYLLVTSGDPGVGVTLGFRPNKVILSGDSSGGYMALVLTLVLNDIRLKKGIDPIETVLMPKAIFGLYPKVQMTLNASPSLLLSTFDVFLNPVSCYNIMSSVYPLLMDINSYEKFDELILNYGDHNPKKQNATINETKHWQQLTNEDKNYFIERMQQFKGHPYLSPLSYEHFDTLKHVALYLYPFSCCPLLDDGVSLAKVWKGAVHLDILEDMIHSSFAMIRLSKQIQRASDRIVGKLEEALDL